MNNEPELLLSQTWRRLTIKGWVANAIGAAIVFTAIGFVITVFFDTAERDALGRENLPLVITLFPVFGVLTSVILRRKSRRALAWIVERREPTDTEHRMTLRLPAYDAFFTAVGWSLSGVIAILFNLDHSLGAVSVLVAAIWLGGETTSALAYLITERTLRPITALALAARAPERSVAPGVRHRLLFAWSLGTGVPVLSVLTVGIVGLTRPDVDAQAVAGACVFLGAVALFVGLFVTVITAKAISDPLNSVRRAIERVGAGELEAHVAIDDASEVGLLQAGFNRMADGLREREQLRDLFGRSVGHEVARAALRDGTRLGGEEREIGALFVDLTGSTSMALAAPPTEVVRLLNRFFRIVVDVIESENGMVNKIEGDAALCVFGAPVASPDPAGEALSAARALAKRLEREIPDIGFGIGVSAGRAVAGNVGAEHRFEYTVIGDPVNEAARVCELAKQRGVPIIASDAALARASELEAAAWEVGERTVLRGRLEATGLASPTV